MSDDVWSSLETSQGSQQPADPWAHLEGGKPLPQNAPPNMVPSFGTQIGHAAEDFAGGLAHSVGNIVDVVTGTPPGQGSYASKFSSQFQHAPDYEQPEIKQQIAKQAPSATDLIPEGPFKDTLKERVPQALEAVGTVGGAGGVVRDIAGSAGARAASTALDESHPLAPVAKQEASEAQGHLAAMEDASGVKVPPRELTPQQRYINNLANDDLNLPKNARVTNDLLDAADKRTTSPGFDNARKSPGYDVSSLPKYQEGYGKIDMDLIDPKWRPDASGVVDPAHQVDMSKQLRFEARRYSAAASNPQFSPEAQDLYRAKANAHLQAAQLVEGGFREAAVAADKAASAATGVQTTARTQIADDWGNARAYKAKIEMWRDTLDGDGNVVASKIRKTLGDDPMTPQMRGAVSIANQAPEMFKSTRIGAPTEGMAKKVAKTVAPMVGAGLGGVLPIPGGPEIGAGVTQWLTGKILK